MAPVRIYTVDEVSDDMVEELRSRFLQEVRKEHVRDHVHPADIQRAHADTMWLKRVMAHGDLEMDKAFEFIMNSVKFRHEWGLNDLTQERLMREVPKAFEEGQITIHTQDRDGAPVLVFHSSIHSRLTGEDIRRGQLYLLYWVEKLDRERADRQRGELITLFLDMSNAGLQNVDIPFLQFLVGTFQNYYPAMLNAIIIFEMHWVFNAVYRLMKQILPPKADLLIKFVSKKNIRDFIAPENVLKRWGGSCTWKWKYRPEEHEMPPLPFLGQEENTVLRKVESTGDTDSNTSQCPDSQTYPDGDSQDSTSLSRYSQCSDVPPSQTLGVPAGTVMSQSVPSLIAITVSDYGGLRGATSFAELPPPVPEKQARKHRPMSCSQTTASFAMDSGEQRPPAVPVRRRTRRPPPPPPPPQPPQPPQQPPPLRISTGQQHFKSMLDLPAQSAAEVQQVQSPVSESGDSGASCDDFSDQSQNGTDETSANIGDLLEVTPGDAVLFSPERARSCRPLTLRCTRHAPVAFKVKTTAPDRFLVRPSRGVVAPGRTVTVELHLAAGVTPQMALGERFLVVATPVKHAQMTSSELEHHWRHAPASSMRERRLHCRLAPEPPLSGLVRRLGQQLAQQQHLSEQLVQRAAATQRWLMGAAAALAALAACNVYLLSTAGGC